MIAASSLIAFGLTFLCANVFMSFVLTGGLKLAEAHIRPFGPRAERRAAALALILPVGFGLALTLILAAYSAISILTGTDHCLDHEHHLHLCLKHGAPWRSQIWVVAITAVCVAFGLMRFGQTAWAHITTQRAALRLKRIGRPLECYERCYLVPADDRFAFTTGLFSPMVIVSTGAWKALDTEERRALIKHELTHVERGDLWKRAALGLTICLGAPYFASEALRLWEVSAELSADRSALTTVGKPSVVASAILSLAQASPSAQRSLPAAMYAAESSLVDRIHALFEEGPDGVAAKGYITVSSLVFFKIVIVTSALFAGTLHHFFETLIG